MDGRGPKLHGVGPPSIIKLTSGYYAGLLLSSVHLTSLPSPTPILNTTVSLYYLALMPSPSRSFNTAFPSDADLFYSCTTSSTSTEDINIHYALPSKSSLKIGVVILSPLQSQLIDLAALDLLAMMGRSRLSSMNASTAALDEAVDEIDIRYVTASGEGSFPITSGGRIPTTVS